MWVLNRITLLFYPARNAGSNKTDCQVVLEDCASGFTSSNVSRIYAEPNLNTKVVLHKGSWLIVKGLSAARKKSCDNWVLRMCTGTFVPSAIEFQGKIFNTEL